MNDKLYFYSKSKDAYAGMGVREYVANPSDYRELPFSFRLTLSNFHIAPFIYDGQMFISIEHAFQYVKLKKFGGINKARCLTVDGALSPEEAKKYGGKGGPVHMTDEQAAEWGAIQGKVMEDIATEKYMQNPDAMKILKLTGNAELWHMISRSSHSVRFTHLERIRALRD